MKTTRMLRGHIERGFVVVGATFVQIGLVEFLMEGIFVIDRKVGSHQCVIAIIIAILFRQRRECLPAERL